MGKIPELIVMLTHNDLTVDNAYYIFDKYKDSKAKFWGFKQKPLDFNQMKSLCSYMKKYGKTTVFEAVSYTENKCIEAAIMAAECGCDILMGTLFYDSVNNFCKEKNIKYMPFIGDVSGRPSVLGGNIDQMIKAANLYIKKGVYGFDLLGYRYIGDSTKLINRFVSEVGAPVCIAGGVDSFKKLNEIKSTGSWSFTIGSAFFENTFNGNFGEQIDIVYDFINK